MRCLDLNAGTGLARPFILWHVKTTMSISEPIKPKKGRPPVDTEPVNLRLPRDLIAALDDFRRQQGDVPTRPEAIRRVLAEQFRR
jgi:hypothetical protein